jgi:hypothetical protein
MPTVREYQAAKQAKGQAQPKAQNKGGNKLASIAAMMYSKVVDVGDWDRFKLVNGLDIILHRVTETQWRLALAREGAYPSEVEVELVRNAFDVPAAAEEARSDKSHTHPKTKRQIVYNRVEITWQEV